MLWGDRAIVFIYALSRNYRKTFDRRLFPLFGLPEIVISLYRQPDACLADACAFESNGKIRADGGVAVHDA